MCWWMIVPRRGRAGSARAPGPMTGRRPAACGLRGCRAEPDRRIADHRLGRLRQEGARMQWMLLRPDDHQAESGHDAGIPRRTHETPGRSDGALSDDRVGADPGFARTDQVLNLQQRVAELEAANTALRAEAESTRLILEGATDYAII